MPFIYFSDQRLCRKGFRVGLKAEEEDYYTVRIFIMGWLDMLILVVIV